MATTKKPAEPLTAAQLEAIERLIADRQKKLLAAVNEAIAAALVPIHAAIDQLARDLQNALKVGDRIALRANSGKLLGARGGGPTTEDEPFTLLAKSNSGPWESYTVERGQG